MKIVKICEFDAVLIILERQPLILVIPEFTTHPVSSSHPVKEFLQHGEGGTADRVIRIVSAADPYLKILRSVCIISFGCECNATTVPPSHWHWSSRAYNLK